MKRRLLSLLLPGLLCAAVLAGCAGGNQNTSSGAASSGQNAEAAQSAETDAAQEAETAEESVPVSDLSAEITLTLGEVPEALADKRVWDEVLAGFSEMYPGVTLHIQADADFPGDTAQDATDAAETPDPAPGLILARPEQLLPGGVAEGLPLRDLTALYTPEAFSALLPNAVNACLADDGHYYAYPFAVNVSCMAVNRRIFEETGAMQYIDEETRSWTTEDFLAAVQLLYDAGYETVLELPCAEEDPADATRSFVLNLFGGAFAAPAYTGYEVRSATNLVTFETLTEQPGIVFAPEKTEADALAAFFEGDVPVVTSWDYDAQLGTAPEYLALCFPTDGGAVQLPGDLYCFALTADCNAAQAEAAEALLSYLTALPFPAKEALLRDGYFPAVRNLRGLYAEEDDAAYVFATHFVPQFGFYDRFAPDYAEACAAWNRMMAQIPLGTDVEQMLKIFPESLK